MASKNGPWNLLLAHRYSEAAEKYAAVLKKRPADAGALGGHATAYLCLGEIETAMSEFQLANEAEARDLRKLGGKCQTYLEQIGTTQWLMGKRREAIRTFRLSAEGVLKRSIEYGDLAGGASHPTMEFMNFLSQEQGSGLSTPRPKVPCLASSKAGCADFRSLRLESPHGKK